MSYPVTEENFPRVRRLPFQDNIHTSIFTPREYQVELLDAARRRNLTACLGNAPSKAFVSVMLIREIAHEIRHIAENKSKWIVVIFTSVYLIQQYAEKIRDHTDLLVGEFIDNAELDDWSKELQNKQVLVMTVQLFSHLLSKQVIQLSNVILIIIGESHQAAKIEHPIRKLMDILKQTDSQTRLLGLSASIMKNQCDEPHLLEMYMNRLERTMGGVAETTSDMVSLSRFGNRFNELVVECIEKDNSSLNYDIINDCLTLDKKIRNIVEPAIDFIMDHVYRPEEIYGTLDEDLDIPDPKIIPKFYLNELLHLLSTLGPWCADRAALRFLKELKKHKDDTPYERHYLLISMVYTIMDMVHAICEHHFQDMIEVEKILKFSSPKVLRLLEILKHFKPLNSNIVPINCKNNESKTDDHISYYNSLDLNKDLISIKNDDSNKTDNSELSTHVNKITLQDVKDDMKSLINLVSDTVTNSENTLYSSCQIIANESLTNDTVRQKNLKNERLENSIINTLHSTRQTHNNMRVNSEVQKDKIISQNNKHDNYTSGSKREYGNRNRLLTFNINVDDPNSLCGLVFVDKRNTACIMHLLLKELSRHHDDFRFIAPNFLVGHTKSPYQQTQQHNENREVMLEHRKQEEVLRRFRLRECNLLVATNVLQDGIDIPKCNLVVRFDLPKDYRSYVQCKGRARATTSHLIHLVEKSEKTKFIDDLARFKTVEEILLNRCHEREIPTDEEINLKEANSILTPYCPSNKENAAKVTMTTAISLVNRYCAKLPSDTFTRLTPRCHLIEKKIDDKTFYQALLFLPINSPVKHPVIGPIMENKALAKMAVALKMCKVLHSAGELDDNLLPVGKESVQQEDELMEHWEEEVIADGAPKPGTTKRRQYYFKRTADAFINCTPKSNRPTYLYVIDMKLTCPIPEEQNTRGRRIYAPEETSRCFGILTSKPIPKICGFPVFTRSGEVTVALKEIGKDILFDDKELEHLSFFHNFTFSKVLRLEKYPMKFDPEVSESSYFIVPLNQEKDSPLTIDWDFLNLIYTYQHFRPHFISDDDRKNFSFDVTKYQDSVVMPWYRNLDQPQYFYVAEICYNLNPKSDFPDDEFETFEKYYFKKYNIQIQNLSQPLLDVDHTSARLNLLTPRYVNRKGVALPTSSEETKRAKRENLQQKQILVPELCTIHPFPASFWRKAVCLPCVLYRINCLLIAEQLRVRVAAEIGLGLRYIENDFQWPILDFGWSLADVLKNHAENKAACIAASESKKVISKDSVSTPQNLQKIKKSSDDNSLDFSNKKKSKNGWEDQTGSKFDIGTWSNDMAAESSNMNSDKFDGDMDMFEGSSWPGNIMMLNDGGIFGDDAELESINEENMSWTGDEPKKEPSIRYGSPSNFEDMGWDFDSNEEIGVMNIPGFSFISAPNGGFNLEDLSRDIEAYEEDGIYQEMQSETFDDEEEKNDYSAVSCWDGNSEITNENRNSNLDNKILEEVDEDVSLEWIVSDYDSESLKSQEESSKEHFACKMKEKVKTINVIEGEEDLHLVIGESNSSEIPNKDETLPNPITHSNSFISPPNNTNNQLMESFQEIPWNDLILDKSEYSKHMSFITPNCDSAYSNESAPYSETVINKCSPGLSPSLLAETENDSNKPFFSFDEQTSLDLHPGPSPSIILQALTMSNANDGINLERLETIGDSYLKHAITTYLYCTYPNIHEGKLSYLRSKQVSNLNLYRLGKIKSLGECMVATKFEPNDNWLPPGYFVPKELEQALIDSGIPAGHWNIANLPDLNDWKDLDAEQIRKALVKPSEDDVDVQSAIEITENSVKERMTQQSVGSVQKENASLPIADTSGVESNPEDMTCFIPYNLMTQHSIPDKSIADCVEALIGAYLTSCGPRGALLFMSWLGIKVLPKIKSKEDDSDDIPRYGFLSPPPSPLLRIIEDPEMELNILLNGYEKFEEKIGYYFQDKSYLLQAFTHASYHYNRLTDCYQRLEFLGDAVLDYLITRHLYEDPRQHSPGTLTDLRSALVNNTIFATLAVKCDFHKYFKAICPGLFVVIDKFVKMQKENNHKLNEEYYFIEEDECEEAEDIEVPKALGDVFESVAGAIYLDSDMSLDTVWRVYYSMMKNEIEQFMTNVPKSPIRELLEMEPETAKFGIPEKTLDGKVRVTVEIFGKGKFRGLGRNYRIAKCTAAKHALKALKRMQGSNSC